MLIFTNRVTQAQTGPAAFTKRFRPGMPLLSVAQVKRAGSGFGVTDLAADLDDDAALQRLVPLFSGPRPLLLYLHGNNNTPAACFERCARLQEIYDVEVIGYSWPAEGALASGDDPPELPAGNDDSGNEDSLRAVNTGNLGDNSIKRKKRRYLQAKLNAQESAEALSRLLRLLATARLYTNAQPVSLAAHSLGAHYLQHTLSQPGVAEALGAQHNIVLLAPCCRSEGHAAWVQRLRPRERNYICFNRNDLVLLGARYADGNDIKLGAEPGVLAPGPQLRYIDFTRGEVDPGGHGYFVRKAGGKVPKWPQRLFERLFRSLDDLKEGQPPRKIYVQGCRADGLVCSMSTDPSIPWPSPSGLVMPPALA